MATFALIRGETKFLEKVKHSLFKKMGEFEVFNCSYVKNNVQQELRTLHVPSKYEYLLVLKRRNASSSLYISARGAAGDASPAIYNG